MDPRLHFHVGILVPLYQTHSVTLQYPVSRYLHVRPSPPSIVWGELNQLLCMLVAPELLSQSYLHVPMVGWLEHYLYVDQVGGNEWLLPLASKRTYRDKSIVAFICSRGPATAEHTCNYLRVLFSDILAP
jgi:hypothetical protein